MSLTVKVLDHGFVKLRNIAGPTRRIWATAEGDSESSGVGSRPFDADDTDPANAARMSFRMTDSEMITKNGVTRLRTREDDLALCSHLMEEGHTGPFEQVEVWLEMKLPIFVARQFVRHRTAMLCEVSGRYIQLPAEWYIPEIVGGKPVGGAKQGQSNTLDLEVQKQFKNILSANCQRGYEDYEFALRSGVAAEHARTLLHLNHYTHWLWKQNLHNLMHFLRLRDHSHAQIEARAYARAIDALVRQYLPNSMELYNRFRRMA